MALFLVLIFALGAYAGEAQPSWLSGERLNYDIRWGFITAGEASLHTIAKPVTQKIEFKVLAHNNGFFEAIYPVRDTIISVVRPGDLVPEYFRKINHEGGWHNRSQVHFDWENQLAVLGDTVFNSLNGPIKRHTDTTVVLDGAYYDIISAFYKVRSLPLEVGKVSFLEAISGKKKYKMRIHCLRKEKIEVLAGKFDCIVVEPILDEDGLFQAKGKLVIWFTDDDLRLPVLMKSKIALGSIRAEMKAWQQKSISK